MAKLSCISLFYLEGTARNSHWTEILMVGVTAEFLLGSYKVQNSINAVTFEIKAVITPDISFYWFFIYRLWVKEDYGALQNKEKSNVIHEWPLRCY